MMVEPGRQKLVDWYSSRHSFRIDLVSDYAGSSPFLIDGDSLLRHVFSDCRIDFDTGFQLLHATYSVEQFLEGLRRRKCVFDIVFFERHQKICTPFWNAAAAHKYGFAREVLIKHLEELNTENDKFVWRFENVNTEDFQEWLEDRRPLFVMAHDGADVILQEARANPDDDSESSGQTDKCDKTEDANDLEVKAMLYRFMNMGEQYNIVLLNNVEFVDSKIYTTVIESGLRRTDTELGLVLNINLLDSTDADSLSDKEPLPFEEISLPPTVKSARESLSVYTLIHYFKSISAWPENEPSIASTYLLHVAYLNHLSLEERHFSIPSDILNAVKRNTNIDRFLISFFDIATKALKGNLVKLQEKDDLCDFVDGRFLLMLLGQEAIIPDTVMSDFERLADAVATEVAADAKALVANRKMCIGTPMIPPSLERIIPVSKSTALLPFSNHILDPHLQSIHLDVKHLPNKNEYDDKAEREQVHWRNPKKLLVATNTEPTGHGVKTTIKKPMLNKGRGQPVDIVEKRSQGKLRKWEQVYLNQMQRYAASLTDSLDGSLNQKLIICDEGGNKTKKQTQEKSKTEKVKAGKGGANAIKEETSRSLSPSSNSKPGKPTSKGNKKEATSKKAPVLSKADKIKLDNAEKAAAKEAKSILTAWKNLCSELKLSKDEESIIFRLDDHIKKLVKDVPKTAADDHEGRFVELEVRLYKVYTLQKMWTVLCKSGDNERGYGVLAVLFDEARKALQSPALTVSAKAILQNVFIGLDIALPPSRQTISTKRVLSFQLNWTGKLPEGDTKLGMSSEEFQLMHFGPYMDRNMDSAPDDRVTFEPDGWQRKVLDEIDADNSVFVVAPTSAGKTFISFHAMEKVMKADDSSVLVYVAPTKPLVNQIAAEVISRFRKNYKHAGKTVWAIHTGDYRMNSPNDCQILITVPTILSTMLLSPNTAKNWAPRVKRIIFDEVHSIGNADDGVIWEQLLLLAPCPIIALSATVGNPEEFSEWLETTQKSLGFKLTMIQHPYRYSDLRKFIYHPPKTVGDDAFHGLRRPSKYGQIDGIPGLDVIHPVSALIDPSHGMPDDLALEPRDCLELYQAMKKVATSEYPVPENLDFRKVFGTFGNVIKKADVINWEASLKSVLQKWIDDPSSPFMGVVQILRKGSVSKHELLGVANDEQQAETALEDNKFGGPAYTNLAVDDLRYLREKTLPLLATLHAQNALPAILFSYDRSLCEYICLQLVTQLQTAEKHWRNTDPRWKAKIEEWEAYMERKKRLGSKIKKVKPTEGESKSDMARDAAEVESSSWDTFNPEDPSTEFSFAEMKRYSKTELEQDLKDLERWDVPVELVEAFKRGIGVHHSGLNRKYRQAVETMFRKGYLRVIIATGTLALGINMPCKTVIFSGDSVLLTALNYRQAAGRAGRRGFDLLGNVIFHGLTLDKANHLISSRLPSLMGHFPISTSLVLRLFILLHHSKYSDHAKTTINCLLTQPRLVIGGESIKGQVLHHLRFSIEYLRRQGLLGPAGTPYNFAGLTSHLYYTETPAYAFHALLCSGYFNEICKGIHVANQFKKEQICIELMLILTHIFGRRPISIGPNWNALPPLPEKARQILLEHNKHTLETYSTYVETFAKEYCDKPDHTLPFSMKTCGGSGISHHPRVNVARSSFFGLSGHTDEFQSIADLSSSLRSGILFEGAAVPYMQLSESGPQNDPPLNSYLYDFYKHGDDRKLAAENGIKAADVWFYLRDFSRILATITAGLVSFLKDGPGAYFDADKISIEDEDGEVLGVEEDDVEEEVIEEAVREIEIEYDSDGEEVERRDLSAEREEEEQKKREARQRMRDYAKVLKGMRILQTSFDEKFKAMWV